METKIYKVKSPDGSVIKVQGPIGASQEEVIRQAQQLSSNQMAEQTQADRIENRTWGDAAKEGLVNIPGSAVNVVKNIGTALFNPIDTLEGVADVVTGYGIDNNVFGMGDGFEAKSQENIKKIDLAINDAQSKGDLARVKRLQEARVKFEGLSKSYTDKSGNMTQMIKDRYGSEQAIKNTIATDPFGLALDATGVGGVARQTARLAGKAGKVGNAVGKATDFIDPIANLGGGVKAIGRGAGALLDTATARVGSQAFGGALRAGADSAQSFLTRKQNPSKGFVEQMRGKIDDTELVELAQRKLSDAIKSKNAKYDKSMGKIGQTRVTKAFDELNATIKKTKDDFARTSGIVTDPAMLKFLNLMEGKVNYFKKNKKLHTIEGMDKLKQSLQGQIESLPLGSNQMKTAGSRIANNVRTAIGNVDPAYKKMMKEYGADAQFIKDDLGKTLSLSKQSGKTIDSTLRKLTSASRNNVNTNFGSRLKTIQSLDEFGEVGALIPQIMGNAFKGFAPRSIGFSTAGVGAAGGVATGVASIPMAAGFLMAQSPRVIGEILYKMGQTGGVPARMLDVLATNTKFTQVIAPYLNLQQNGLNQ